MDYKKSIYFLKQTEKYHGYSTTAVYRRKKWKKFWTELVRDSFMLNSMKQFMTTQLPRRLFRRAKHIMALDCDSYTDMRSATGSLFFNQISHCVIESSPGRYWVITDRVGRVKELYPLMRMAGVDRDYVRFTDCRKSFHLRAYPKNGFVPRQVGIWVSRDILSFREHTGGNLSEHYRLYREWLGAFLDYWNSPDMDMIASNLRNSMLVEEAKNLAIVIDGNTCRWERANLISSDDYSDYLNTQYERMKSEPSPEPEDPIIEINNCLDCMEI